MPMNRSVISAARASALGAAPFLPIRDCRAELGRLITMLAALALAACSGGGPIAYETCEVGGRPCRGVDGCSEVRVEYVEGTASAGICTSLCATDEQCPLDVRGVRGACLEFPGVTECFERCTTGDDCPDGLGCVDRLVDSDGNTQFLDAAVCLPVISR